MARPYPPDPATSDAPRMAGSSDISALRMLADLVEPVKEYARMESVRALGLSRTLKQLIDGSVRRANRLPSQPRADLHSGRPQGTDPEAQIRAFLRSGARMLRDWQPLLERSFFCTTLRRSPEDLSALGALLALQALDYLDIVPALS